MKDSMSKLDEGALEETTWRKLPSAPLVAMGEPLFSDVLPDDEPP